MADHGLDLFSVHAVQEARAYRHQGRVLEGAGGKGIRLAVVDGNFRHANAGGLGKTFHRADDPAVRGVGAVVDDLRARGPLGHGLADQQRNDRTAKTHQRGKAQQHAEVQPVGREVAVDAQQAGGNAQHQHDGQVGDDEEQDAFHGGNGLRCRGCVNTGQDVRARRADSSRPGPGGGLVPAVSAAQPHLGGLVVRQQLEGIAQLRKELER